MKTYRYKKGFSITKRMELDGVVYCMGEHHICDRYAFDLYKGKEFIGTYDTFEEASTKGHSL